MLLGGANSPGWALYNHVSRASVGKDRQSQQWAIGCIFGVSAPLQFWLALSPGKSAGPAQARGFQPGFLTMLCRSWCGGRKGGVLAPPFPSVVRNSGQAFAVVGLG